MITITLLAGVLYVSSDVNQNLTAGSSQTSSNQNIFTSTNVTSSQLTTSTSVMTNFSISSLSMTLENSSVLKVIATIPVPETSDPIRFALNPVNNEIYVVGGTSYVVSIINASTNKLVGTINLTPRVQNSTNSTTSTTTIVSGAVNSGVGLSNVIYDPTNHYVLIISSIGLYEVNSSNKVANFIQISSPELATFPYDGNFGYDPINGEVYFPSEPENILYTLNGSTNSIVALHIQSPNAATFDPANGLVYVSNVDQNTVTALNSSNQVVATVQVGNHPETVYYNPVNDEIYVPNIADGTVSVIGSNNTVLTTLEVGGGAYAMVGNTQNGNFYAANEYNDTMTVINATNSVVATLPAGSGPEDPLFDPAIGAVISEDFNGNTVSVISSNNTPSLVSVGSGPFDALFCPSNGNVYIVNTNSNSVSVIS